MFGEYHPELPAVVAAPFTYAGKRMRFGEPFPHRETEIGHLALRGLHAAGLIKFVQPIPAPVAAQAPLQPPTRPVDPSRPARPARDDVHRNHRR